MNSLPILEVFPFFFRLQFLILLEIAITTVPNYHYSINSGYSYLESEFLAQTPVVIYLGILKRFFVFSFCIYYYFSFFRAFSLTCLSCGENYTNKTRNNFLYYHSIQRFFDIHIF